MNNNKKIQIIHAQDANQHLGYLTKILEQLKLENRIGSFSLLPHDSITDASFESLSEDDMVVTMLTKGLIGLQIGIEEQLIAVKRAVPKYKMVEIIVDNIPYHPEFIALPANLEPIRNSENMDMVWQGIEEKFKVLFPLPTPPPPPPPAPSFWKKYLPYILGVLVLICLAFIVWKFVIKSDTSVAKKTNATAVQIIETKAEFVVEDVFTITGRGTVVSGKITKGSFKSGDQVFLNDTKDPIICTGIMKSRRSVEEAKKGEEVGLLLRGIAKDALTRGDKLIIR